MGEYKVLQLGVEFGLRLLDYYGIICYYMNIPFLYIYLRVVIAKRRLFLGIFWL